MSRAELPHSYEAEASVLGAGLIEDNLIKEIPLAPDDFYYDAHVIIWKTMQDMVSKGERVDQITLHNALTRASKENIGVNGIDGASYLAHLIAQIPSVIHVQHYAGIVKEMANLRKIIQIGGRVVAYAHGGLTPNGQPLGVVDIIAEAQKEFAHLDQKKDSLVVVGEALEEAWEGIRRRIESPRTLLGHPSGLIDLDRKLQGFQKGQFYIIGARPAMGKTTLLLNIQYNVSRYLGLPTLFISLEMSLNQVVTKLLFMDARVSDEKWKAGLLTSDDWERLEEAKERLGSYPLYIIDKSQQTVATIIANARRVKTTKGLALLGIDYLQLIALSSQHKGNLVTGFSEVSRALKLATKSDDLDCPVICLSQLSREAMKGDSIPQLHHLRDSGALEQDADVVLFLDREDMRKVTTRKDITDVIIAKNRFGRMGPNETVPLRFDGATSRFDSLVRSAA